MSKKDYVEAVASAIIEQSQIHQINTFLLLSIDRRKDTPESAMQTVLLASEVEKDKKQH